MKTILHALILLLCMPALTAQNTPAPPVVKARVPFRADALGFDGDTWRWAASGHQKTIVAKAGRILKEFDQGASIPHLQFRDGGRLLGLGWATFEIASGTRREVMLYDDRFWRAMLDRITYTNAPDFAVCYWMFAPGKRGSGEPYLPDEMNLYQLSKGKAVGTYTHPGGWQGDLELASGGSYFAIATMTDTVELWDWQTGAHLQSKLIPHGFSDQLLAFSPDAQQLALRDAGGGLQVMDLPGLTTQAALDSADAHTITHMVWEPDGQALLFVCKGTGLMRWQPMANKPPQLYVGGAYESVAISPKGDKLLLGSATEVLLLTR